MTLWQQQSRLHSDAIKFIRLDVRQCMLAVSLWTKELSNRKLPDDMLYSEIRSCF
jgi:hypothetical protein